MKILPKILSPQERAAGERTEKARAEDRARQVEDIRRESDLLKPDAGRDVTDPEQQAGRILPRSLVMQRLRKLNPALLYEQARKFPDRGGIYYAGYLEDRTTGRVEYGRWFICGIPHERVREFDLRITTPRMIPDTSIALHSQTIQGVEGRERGWRSILLELVRAGLIPLDRADLAFHITGGPSSKNWQTAMSSGLVH